MATNNQKENVKPNEEKKKTRVPSGLLGIFTFLGLIALIKGLGSTSKIKSAFQFTMISCGLLWPPNTKR